MTDEFRKRRGMSRARRLIGAALLGSAIAMSPLAAQSKRWGGDYLTNATVVDQNGNSLRFYDDAIKGKIVVISFVFTNCRTICPLVTARLAELERKLGEAAGRDVFFVSVSIDPVNDTPEKMREFASAFNAGPSWKFLTGEEAALKTIGYRLGERADKLNDHRNQILLYNDRTGDWERSSAFADLEALTVLVRSMDPDFRRKSGETEAMLGDVVPAQADLPGQTLFIKSCAACHTIGGGKRVGPDLHDVSRRRQRDWLGTYIADPDALRRSRDPQALALRAEHPNIEMPNLNLAAGDIQDLLLYIDLKSSECDQKAHAAHK